MKSMKQSIDAALESDTAPVESMINDANSKEMRNNNTNHLPNSHHHAPLPPTVPVAATALLLLLLSLASCLTTAAIGETTTTASHPHPHSNSHLNHHHVVRTLQTTTNSLLDQQQNQVLEALFLATNGNEWTHSENWMVLPNLNDNNNNNNNNIVCTWHGITCTSDKQHVEKIELSDNNLRGSVPLHALLRMPYLKVLKLDGNSLTFAKSPPSTGSYDSAGLDAETGGGATETTNDNDDNNNIIIQPSVWEGLIFDASSDSSSNSNTVTSNLQYIDVSHTDILGGSFSNLLRMAYTVQPSTDNTGNNNPSSSSSQRSFYFPKLTDLYLSGCNLHGDFPAMNNDIGAHSFGTTLERWSLDDNGFGGTIPFSFGTTMTNLRVFSANNNNLEGELPLSLGNLRNLRDLGLRGNVFYGEIPPGLKCDGSIGSGGTGGTGGGATRLEKLDLSRQRGVVAVEGDNSNNVLRGLTGNLPSFSQCENLRRLDLSHNQIGGSVPSNFLENVDPLTFESASLSFNAIEGMLPGKPLIRFDVDAIDIQENRITSLEEELLCNSDRSGAIAAFGCSAVLCSPGTYRPGTGRQEEVEEACIACEGGDGSSDYQYWGATSCGGSEVSQSDGSANPSLDTPSVAAPVYEENEVAPVVEKDVLMELYDGTGGANWVNSDGWGFSSNVPICDWYGILCSPDDEAVESIDLGGNNLVVKQGSSVPTSVFHLPSLKYLVLKDNALFTSSSSDGKFFRDIDRALSLEVLDLSSTGLSGVTGIEGASTLNELHIDYNDFSGSSVPNEIFSLNRLRVLTMDQCNLSGNINPIFNFLKNLQVFSASDNKLSGGLLQGGYLSTLSILRLRNNYLTGTLPTSLNLFASLTTLDLSGQRHDDENSLGLQGNLLEFSQLPNLKRLDLSQNSLSGPIPGFFLAGVDPKSFEFVDLADNLLVASFPVGLSPIFNKVYLQNNKITSVQQICDSALGGSDLEFFGCDSILCEPGTFNSLGRSRSFDNLCKKCTINGGAQYYGSVSCDGPKTLTIRDAVELIYSSCNGKNWISSNQWMDETLSVCQWEGIVCSDDGDVIEISLRSNNLLNTFPTNEVFKAIPTLTTLALEGNDVSFSFDDIESPATQFTMIDLTNTKLLSFDGIDEFVPNLTELYAGNNNIADDFPNELLKLTQLRRLDISFNILEGQLPNNIGSSWKNLELLVLHHNKLSGSLPSSLGEMSSLHYLELQSNGFSGEIPTEISGLDQLWGVDFSQQTNQGGGFTGSLSSFSNMPDLKTIDLSNNKIQGSIPSDFLGKIEPNSFEKLNLSSNFLQGELKLPKSIAGLSPSKMDFSNNQFTSVNIEMCGNDCAMVLCAPTTYSVLGRQPSLGEYCDHCPTAVYWGTTFCPGLSPTQQPVEQPNANDDEGPDSDISEVDTLKLLYELCGGKSWFRNESWMSSDNMCDWHGITCVPFQDSVQSIVLSGNNLVQQIPPAIFRLPNLETLVLDSNDINVDFSSIKYASKMTNLDLSSTGLFSVNGINQAPTLLSLDISRNDFKSSIPIEIFQISTLQQLFMGNNEFDTSLPSDIGDLQQLRLFSCASSMLTGPLPKNLGNLKELVHLNLEENALTGALPIELESLENLAFVDMSGNALDGELLSFSSLNNLRRVDLSKNAFSKSIPDDFLASVNPLFFDFVDLRGNFLTGVVPSILSHFDVIYLQNNLISGIDSELCDEARGGLIKQFECDAILCPPGTFNAIGRQDSETNSCRVCSEANYYGTTACGSTSNNEKTDELLSSNIVEEKQALSKLYLACGGEYWTDNTHWMDSSISICNWKGVKCREGTETVVSLQLGSNNIQGFPGMSMFDSLPNLSTLSLSSNPLSGFNFNGIENSLRLSELDLDATGLSSVVGIGMSPSLTHISLRNNHLSGFPQELFQIKTMKTLLMSNNRLDGRIPNSFDQLPNLETLILNSNSLTGDLNDISFPATLRILDLSHNHLSKAIPATFLNSIPSSAELDIDLSGNQLSGAVPGELARFDEVDLYLQNNLITAVDPAICSQKDWNSGDVGKYGCLGILCPSGHYSKDGRQSANDGCSHCSSATFFGTTVCEGESGGLSTSLHFVAKFISALVGCCIFCQ